MREIGQLNFGGQWRPPERAVQSAGEFPDDLFGHRRLRHAGVRRRSAPADLPREAFIVPGAGLDLPWMRIVEPLDRWVNQRPVDVA